MEKSVVTFDKGTTCSSWNYCGERLATGSINGALAIFDSVDPASSSFTCTSTSRVHEVSIVKVVWVPPEYGGGVACICADGTLSLWEEYTKPLQWKLCKGFETSSNQVLDMQFGVSFTSLKLAAAYSNDHVKVYELLDPLELKNWQLQAEFHNVIDSVSKFGKAACLSASISWTPQRGESQQLSFVLGFNLNVMQLNSAKFKSMVVAAVIRKSAFERFIATTSNGVDFCDSTPGVVARLMGLDSLLDPRKVFRRKEDQPNRVCGNWYLKLGLLKKKRFSCSVQYLNHNLQQTQRSEFGFSFGSPICGRCKRNITWFRMLWESQCFRMQLKLLKMEFGANADGLMFTASDKDVGQGFVSVSEDNEIFNDESWESFHLIDVLIDSGYDDVDPDTFVSTWYSLDCSRDPCLFDNVGKKYSKYYLNPISWPSLYFIG
ncbi:unnamed protein product [Camellia sinensis]